MSIHLRLPGAWLLAATLVSAVPLAASPAAAGALSGRVLDAAGAAVSDAQITVIEVGRSTLTDAAGRYAFTNLPAGVHRVALQRIGFAPAVKTVTVGAADATLDFRLDRSLVELAPVQVTASATATTPLTSPQPVSVLDDEALRTARAATVGETVRELAGLRSWSTGGGIGKPVIRGLRSDRVLVLADGARLENQGWGDEHGPNVDTDDVERIEVIRGPASVLYGSDALGGVVNLIAPPLPTAFDRAPFVRGRVSGGFQANGTAPRGHLGLEAARGGLGARGSISGYASRDRETPAGTLFNSGGGAGSWRGEVGARGGWGSLAAGYGQTSERVEIHEDPAEDPTATPYQDITDRTGHLKAMIPVGGDGHVDFTGTYGRNERREFEAARDVDYALGLLARTWTGDVRMHHAPIGDWHGMLGVAALTTDFRKSGPESLIPESDTENLAVYLFEQLERERFRLAVGARWDRRDLSVADDADLGVTAQERAWDALSGNVGVLWRFATPAAVALNVGRGFRAPSTFDLFSNGVHEGTVAYEVGDPGLDVETSLNTDVALRVQSGRLSGELAGFVNRIDDFIYSRPTGTFDPGSGFEIFQVTQGDARLAGAELSGEWHPLDALHLHLSSDWVRGDNTATDTPLPWIPPFRALYGVRLERPALGGLTGAYVDVTAESNAAQDRLDPADVGTAASTLLHLTAGFRVPNDGKAVIVDFGAKNVFDETYRDFMSRYKAYADAPGRSLWLRVASTF